MTPSTIELPCRSHRSCTFHKHWSSSAPPTETETAPKNSNVINITASAGDNQESKKPSVTVPIQRVPTELLLEIITYLSPVEQACLALTCRSLTVALGSDVWKRKHPSWFQHDEMLDMLQRDVSSDDYWRCRECLLFHVRAKTVPKDEPGWILGPDSRLTAVMRWRRDENCLRLGVLGDPVHVDDPIYVLDHALLKATMDRHFLGSSQGVCLNTLKCQGSRTFALSETANMVLKYDFAPKIVLDRLLLQSTYTFGPQLIMFVQNMAIEEASTQVFLESINFWICAHECTKRIIRSLELQPGRRSLHKNQRCSRCPTQYDVSLVPNVGLCIQAWQNFGSGRSRKDEKWIHFSRAGRESKQYVWGKENLGEAFVRIMCSTKEEFQRQVERSDGGGSWYDPELKRRAYKTLPTMLAERL